MSDTLVVQFIEELAALRQKYQLEVATCSCCGLWIESVSGGEVVAYGDNAGGFYPIRANLRSGDG